MFNLKKHTLLCRKKADKKILSDSNDFLLNHKLLMIN